MKVDKVSLILTLVALVIAMVAMVVSCVATTAQAEVYGPPMSAMASAQENTATGEADGDMFDWATLLTTSGATAAVLLIVQFLKVPLDHVWVIPTRVFVLVLSFGVMVAAKAFTTGMMLVDIPLLVVNAFVVALAAMGAYEATFAKMGA